MAGVASAQSVAVPNATERALTRSLSTVVVLPFANISGQSDDDWIGIGISETVAADVERMGGFSVVAREALLEALNSTRLNVARVLRDEALARDLARDLGVAWIVTGGYQRLGDQLRITVRIVDVATGAVRETAKVDGRFDEIFALQDRIVAQLGDSLASLSGDDVSSVALARRPAGDQGNGDEGEGATEQTIASRPPSNRDRREGRRPGADATANGVAPPDVVSGGIAIGGRPPGRVAAAVTGDAGVLAGRVTVRPVRAETPPAIDGLLDDTMWQNAATITEFVQREPVDGAPATEETDVYLAYDDSNLYLGFHAKYEDPGMMRANRVDRDRAGFGDDTISVYFDTFLSSAPTCSR